VRETQTTFEAFYRFDASENLAISADAQWLINPALAPNPLGFSEYVPGSICENFACFHNETGCYKVYMSSNWFRLGGYLI